MIPFLFAVHSHQPVGNFGHVFEKAYNDSYMPFLETMEKNPEMKFTLHYSGCLLDWIQANRPEHVRLLQKMVSRGQVEILGGGYYEPILTCIPRRDAKGQICLYLDHLEKLFGQRPRGIWLTERVWDPGLPELLHDTGVEFTLVDDSHFRFAGIDMDDAWGPYIAETAGKSILVFPIDKELRYKIPFQEPSACLEYLFQRARKDPDFVACYGDDGEKFGIWPDTYEWVFEKGWLDRFLAEMSNQKDRIAMTHFGDYLSNAKPRGRAYIPPASYDEMMEWVLPPHLGLRLEKYLHELKYSNRAGELAPFVRGGHWEMFLAKYNESNRMQKRMLLASNGLDSKKSIPLSALKSLYQSQCNCAYWHGVFGGLYLNFLRHAIYEKILEAEELGGLNKKLCLEKTDYDLDGLEEILVTSPHINAIVSPGLGGSIVSLEIPGKRFSLSNVMARRKEAYHSKLLESHNTSVNHDEAAPGCNEPATIHEIVKVKEEGLEKFLVYDRFQRLCLQDHLLPAALSLEEIESEKTIELGSFAGKPYELIDSGSGKISLKRTDYCGSAPFTVSKNYLFQDIVSGFDIEYKLKSEGQGKLKIRFAVEWNLTLLDGNSPDHYYRIDDIVPEDSTMSARAKHTGATKLEMINKPLGFQVVLISEQPCELFYFPVETVSQSESGFERTYQGSCIWQTWVIDIPPSGSWSGKLQIRFQEDSII